MQNKSVEDLTPVHKLIALDYVTEGLTNKELADKHAVSLPMIVNLKKSDSWGLEVKSMLDELRSVSMTKLHTLQAKAIEVQGNILGDLNAKDCDRLRAADSILDRTLGSEAKEPGKVVLHMTAPKWAGEKEDSKSNSPSNIVQVVLNDSKY